MTPFDSIDNLKLPQESGSVHGEGGRLIGDDAWMAGAWTASLTGASHIVTAPQDAGVLLWLLGLVITGLFGIASTAIAVLLKHYLSERRARRQVGETAKRLDD